MNTILKRVISLLLCVVMTVGYMPVNAFATESGETVTAEATEVTAEQTEAASEETEAPSESTESLAELSEVTDGSDEEEKSEKELKKEEKEAEKESKKEEKEAEKEAKKEEKEAEKEAKKEEKESKKETEPSTEPSTEATEPSTEATEPSTEATEPSTEPTSENLLMTLEIEDEADPVAAALEVRAGVEVSSTALAEAQAYIDALTINNTSNDPATVVGNFGTHFTWDNEKRESSKSYLFDWSYYNGVVFEGLEYLYEVTGKTVYKDYVEEYMSSMITANGTWASCTNDTSKQAAGYNSTHGADCYKTASLLMDLYEMTKDKRYLTMAATLYADLDAAAKSYSLSNAGNNYRHTWASDSTPDLWLDGLYMILPFRAEYAAYIGDTEELDLIVSRMQWVSDNMYNEAKGLFYHAADSATSNSGTYWLRSIGWYAAAIVDVMDSMTGDNLRAMQTQLKKLVDGMLLVQNSTNGMWLNNMAAAQSSTNPYETSGTALVCYAVMKAVNEGWLDADYADMAVLAFNGICNEKLSGTTLTDICFKGAPGDSNSTFYNNEGKGVGPFIMLYAEVLEYTGVKPEEPEESEPTKPADQEITVEGTTEDEAPVTMTVSGVSAEVKADVLKDEDKALLDAHEGIESYVAIDVTGTLAEGEQATFTVAIPEGWDADRVVGISVEEGEVKEITGTHENGYFTFTVDHFSAKGVGLTAKAAETTGNSGTGELVSGTVYEYELDTNGVDDGANYIIVAPSDAVVMNNTVSSFNPTNGTGRTNSAAVAVTINDNTISLDTRDYDITFNQRSNGTYRLVNAEERYVWHYWNAICQFSNNYSWSITDAGSGQYTLSGTENNTNWRMTYSNGEFTALNQAVTVRLYKYTGEKTLTGGTVIFTVTPAIATIQPNETVTLNGTVTVDGTEVELSKCTITWASSDTSKATVSNGTVTGVADGTANITATLSAVNGTALQENIVLTIPVTVLSKAVKSINVNGDEGYVPKSNNPATVVEDEAGNAVTVTVTYDDNTSETINLTVSMLNVATPNVKGEYSGLIASYGDAKDESGFTLNVVDNPGENFPEYPEEGSVDVNKVIGDVSQFQNLGVAEVQLSTSGIPMKVGVDAVLTIDISNSMCWEPGTETNNPDNNKLDHVMSSVEDFAEILFAPNEDGSASDNTITIVFFAGKDTQHWSGGTNTEIDSVLTAGLRLKTVADVKKITENTTFLAMDGNNYRLQIATVDSSGNLGTYYGQNRGDTNYDYAFWQTEQAVDSILAANEGSETNREIHVLFMTDGCPTHFNNVYYNSGSVGNYYIPGSDTTDYSAAGDFKTLGGEAWINWVKNSVTTNGGNTYAKRVFEKVTGLYAVGFDMANGAFAGIDHSWPTTAEREAAFIEIVGSIVGRRIPVTNATDTGTLNTFYTSLAHSIRQAATNAYFVDQMGAAFDLQLGNYITKFAGTTEQTTYALNPLPAVKVMTYKIYRKADVGKEVGGETVTQDMVGQRYGEAEVVETVVFSADGTKAFSSVDGYTSTTTTVNDVTVTDYTGTDIMNDGVICAENFWYNTTKDTKTITLPNGKTYDLPAETFYWNIGTISDKEFVMSYYVYLVNSAEGKAPAGTYPTNTEAILHYTNWLDNDVSQDTQSPVLAWKSASVYYAFYLVDNEGNPVVNQATGEIGSFTEAIKVSNKVFYEEVMLNSQSGATSELKVTTTVVPPEYAIYDPSAVYTVTVDSGNTASGWVIDTEMEKNTTYVTDFHGTDSSNAKVMNEDSYSYTSTTVWFAVVWEPQALPDTVVIDYGLPVDITVLSNDMFGSAGALTGIGLESNIPTFSGTQKYGTTPNANFGKTLNTGLKYGTAAINGSNVRYTPNTMQMPGYDRFAYEASYQYKGADGTQQTRYYYNTITVIPATTIYYEDSFINYSSDVWSNEANAWVDDTEKNLWTIVQNDADAKQDEDRPGEYSLADKNNIYGYDSAYTKMSTYSLNGYAQATVDYDHSAVAEFDFYGTGFDVISVTDKTTGTIIVKAYPYNNGVLSNTAERSFTVDTYYGYTRTFYEVEYTYDAETEKWNVTKETEIAEDVYLGATDAPIPTEPEDDETRKAYEFRWTPTTENVDPLYQVPVMKMSELPYGKYHVVIRAQYDPFFDHSKNGNDEKYDFYLDAIRIYDPANDGEADGTTDTTIEDAYVADSEGWPTYIELRNKILEANSFDQVANDKLNPDMEGLVFIDGDSSVGNAQISDYRNYGPNNEVYLAKNQRVAFKLNLDAYKNASGESVVDKVHIGIKSADGKVASYTITNISEETGQYYNPRTSTISTATDMYYDLTPWANDIIVISNYTSDTGTDGIISLTNIKVTFTEKPVETNDGEDDNAGNGEGGTDTGADSGTGNDTSTASFLYMTPAATTMTLRSLNSAAEKPEETLPDESVPETTVPDESVLETTVPDETEPEETEPEETQPDKEAEKIQKEIEKALKKAAKEAEKIAKELQKAAEKAAKALSKLFGSWF